MTTSTPVLVVFTALAKNCAVATPIVFNLLVLNWKKDIIGIFLSPMNIILVSFLIISFSLLSCAQMDALPLVVNNQTKETVNSPIQTPPLPLQTLPPPSTVTPQILATEKATPTNNGLNTKNVSTPHP